MSTSTSKLAESSVVVKRIGPEWTNDNGELDISYLTCVGCQHLGIHDRHYPYCGAQDAPNKHSKPGEYAYPWPGAGLHIMNAVPNEGCPYLSSYLEAYKNGGIPDDQRRSL